MAVLEDSRGTISQSGTADVRLPNPRVNDDIYCCIAATDSGNLILPVDAAAWVQIQSIKFKGLTTVKVWAWTGSSEPTGYDIEHGSLPAAFMIVRSSGLILADFGVNLSAFNDGSNVEIYEAYFEDQFVRYATMRLTKTNRNKNSSFTLEFI